MSPLARYSARVPPIRISPVWFIRDHDTGVPLGPQQAEGGEVPDAALDEPLAPLVATEKPEPVHQSRVARLCRCELKHLWVAVGVPREK